MSKLHISTQDKRTLNALQFICGAEKQICRLCLGRTENKISLEKLVKIETPYYNGNTISYRTMLEQLNVSTELLLPHILCNSCSEITINSYLFIKLKEFSSYKWNNVLRILTSSLTKVDSIEADIKTAYLVLNGKDNLFLTSTKNYSAKTNRTMILRDIKTCRRKQQMHKYYECEDCNKRFTCPYYLMKHKKLHKQAPYPCKHCIKVFPTRNQMKDHKERVHYPKTLPCSHCDKKFPSKNTLRLHRRLHHMPAICRICKIDFPTGLELRAHLDKHGADVCPHCNKSFTSQHTFKIHIKSCGEKGYEKNKYICDICRKSYSTKNGLITHIGIDHGFAKNVLTCEWCNKKFDAVSRLKNHIVKHTRERNFSCEHCGKWFVTNAALTYHIRLHTGERPYPCDLCNEAFLSASRRMEHKKRVHIGPTKECSLCQRKFLTKFQLKKHLKRHFNYASKLYITDTDHYFPKFTKK